MPQMMPINWLILLIYFILVFFLFNIMNYFIFMPKILNTSSKKKFHKTYINWKW